MVVRFHGMLLLFADCPKNTLANGKSQDDRKFDQVYDLEHELNISQTPRERQSENSSIWKVQSRILPRYALIAVRIWEEDILITNNEE